ncbi:MAG: hypothetical protein KJN90_07100 [Gammaproteobacteria bacterium]|nr:hypothetical protein [Gammaproteobacteria bacterium]
MNVLTGAKRSRQLFAILVLAGSLSSPGTAMAQDTATEQALADDAKSATENQTTQSEPELLEEITVVGEQNFISIRYRIERAEDNLFGLFNDLNSRDDFDIVCRTIRITNSNIPRRSCEPVFFTELRRNSSQFAQSELRQAWSDEGIDIALLDRAMDLIPEDKELQELAATTFEQLQEEMLRIATENPKYLEALMQLGEVKALLQRERQKQFGVPDND